MSRFDNDNESKEIVEWEIVVDKDGSEYGLHATNSPSRDFFIKDMTVIHTFKATYIGAKRIYNEIVNSGRYRK